jgi:hypothetical protein
VNVEITYFCKTLYFKVKIIKYITKSFVSFVFSSNVTDMSGHYLECAGHLAYRLQVVDDSTLHGSNLHDNLRFHESSVAYIVGPMLKSVLINNNKIMFVLREYNCSNA